MSAGRQVLSYATLVLITATFCAAQNIAPVHSGTVDYFEGDVTIDGVKLVSQVARFSAINEQSVLHTGLGRAEILLTPGVLLRVGENTSVKMLDNRLMSTRVEFLSGTAMVEAVDSGTTVKDPPVTIIYKGFEAQPVHNGVFELKSQPSQVRVFKGEAKVVGNGTSLNVKDGNQVDLTTTMASSKFDAKEGDDLYVWSRDRSAYLSAGNMSSARSLAASGYGNSFGYGNAYAASGWDPTLWNGFSGGWYYNQYLNMYSYLPFAGTMYSPFGYGYYNPLTIGYVYTPGYYWQGAGGSRTGTTTGVPLSSLAGAGTARTGVPQLPRLGTTATLRPTVSSPTNGIQPSTSTGALTARGGSSAPAVGGGVSSNARSAAPAATASVARASTARR
jgi:hypothetical protein